MWILTILGYVLLVLLLLLLLLLIIPIKYSFTGEKYDNIFIKAKVSILLGLIGIYYYNDFKKRGIAKITILGLPINMPSKKKKGKNKYKKDRNNDFGDYLNESFIKSLLRSIKKIIFHIKPKKFEIVGKIAFEDPYYTGLACAFKDVFYSKLKNAKISIDIVFEDEIIEGSCLIQGRAILLYVAYIMLRLYRSRPVKIKPKKTKFKEVRSYDI